MMATNQQAEFPKYHELMNPALKALHDLGGSASIAEMEDQVASLLGLSEEAQGVAHGRMTLLGYRLAWARFYLKVRGIIVNSRRGIWSLTVDGAKTQEVDPREVIRFVNSIHKNKRTGDAPTTDPTAEPVVPEAVDETEWKEDLLRILHELDPTAFERLCLRLLRESGFTEVAVTQRGADGGIDGQGIVRLQGLVSLPVVFQAKRWSSNVGSSIVRDFRGAMSGRADKGIIITTAAFTADAHKEATRPGAGLIDLIDGDRLVELLGELELGTSKETVVRVHPDFFGAL